MKTELKVLIFHNPNFRIFFCYQQTQDLQLIALPTLLLPLAHPSEHPFLGQKKFFFSFLHRPQLVQPRPRPPNGSQLVGKSVSKEVLLKGKAQYR